MGKRQAAWLGLGLGLLAGAGPAASAGAQERRLEVGLEASVVKLSQLDDSDRSLRVRLGLNLSRSVAFEALLGYSPGDLGDPAVSASRSQALAGLKLGRRGGRTGIFATLQAGVTRFAEAPAPFACIAIYPPPLACTLAGGDTLPTLAFGGAFERYPSARTVLRLELGDQLLRYPGPVFDVDGQVRDGSFWDHDLRVTVGLGWRF